MNRRLSNARLNSLAAEIGRPHYDRAAAGIGIVHLGIGAFHRAHQAAYTEDVLNAYGGDWRILGVSLRRPAVCGQLRPQDGLYTLAVQGNASRRLRVIGAVKDVLVAREDPATVVAAMTDPQVRIVSLTVTEKGYCHDPATGLLNETHADIEHDLAEPDRPRSTLGFIVSAIRRRLTLNVPPFTLLCCDNLPANGKSVRATTLRFAELLDPELGRKLDACLHCPSSMVDRIVPATTLEDVAELHRHAGYLDRGMVKAEPFRQWVIEDDFPLGRPAWEEFGALMVSDVTPYEEAKLRLLNGSHSALAYLGYLAGCTHVHEVMAIPAYRDFIKYLMEKEIQPSLDMPQSFDLSGYRRELLDRFDNAAIQHRTHQVASDGSQKLRQRLLNTLRYQLAHDGPIDALALAVAAWMRYSTGVDEQGRPIEVQDPMSALLHGIFREHGRHPGRLARAYLSLPEIFGADLGGSDRLAKALEHWLGLLFAGGASVAVRSFLAS